VTHVEKTERFVELTACAISLARLRENPQGNGCFSFAKFYRFEINSIRFSYLHSVQVKSQARHCACTIKDARV